MREVWKPVVGWEHYQVSNLGNTRSARGLLKPKVDSRGYATIGLYTSGIRRQIKIAVLVLTAFKGPRPKGFEVDHRNRLRGDDRLANLRWITKLENMRNRDYSSSGVPGVSWYSWSNKWRAYRTLDCQHIGYFDTVAEASKAVQKFERKHR